MTPIHHTVTRAREGVRQARAALGDRRARKLKRDRAVGTVRGMFDGAEKARRIHRLIELELLDRAPNTFQRLFGSALMFTQFLIPAARKLYKHTGKSFMWQQVLRFLDEPCAVIDPTGLAATEESIRSHLVQVTHHHAAYDVELLLMFPGGLDRLIDEVRLLTEGRHPRQAAIDAIIEHPDYHARLLAALERYRDDPAGNRELQVMEIPPGTEEIFAGADRFATPSAFFAFCAGLPRSPGRALRRAA